MHIYFKALLVSLSVFFWACGSDEEINVNSSSNCDTTQDPPLCTIPTGIITNTTELLPTNRYQLVGPVVFGDNDTGAQLTIRPGTEIIATTADSELVINYRSAIIAVGLDVAPIRFTKSSSIASWRGISIEGNDFANCFDQCPWTRDTTLATNISQFRFVQINGAGTSTTAGLTIAGITEQTIIDNVHINSAPNGFDGLHLLGGAAQIKKLLVTSSSTALAWDYGYSGRIQFAVLSANGSPALSASNHPNDASARPRSNPTLSNLTIVGQNTAALAIRTTSNGEVYNSIFDAVDADCIVEDNSLGFLDSFYIDTTILNTCETDVNLPLGGSFNQFVVDPLLVRPSDPQNPNFAPTANSPALSSTVVDLTTNSATVTFSSFFEETTYIGGVESETNDWTRVFLDLQP